MERNLIEDIARQVIVDLLTDRTLCMLYSQICNYDKKTGEHCQNVAFLAAQVGIEMNLENRDIRSLVYGGLLHDVGKLMLPLDLLNKEGFLTEQEYFLIKSHPAMGARYVQSYGFSQAITDIILYHHERADGSGYPYGLTDIPLLVQIVSICDAYDAMTSDRSYHPKKNAQTSLDILYSEKVFSKDLLSNLACLSAK